MDTTDYTAEIWKAIECAPGYEVSDFGRVRRSLCPSNGRRAGRLLSTVHQVGGYRKVSLKVNGRPKTLLVHRLVCIAFIGPKPEGRYEVGHLDGRPANNVPNNLKWVTPRENASHRRAHGTVPDQRGEKSHKAILTDEAVAIIRSTRRYNGVLTDLSRRFGVSENTVMQLRTRGCRKWHHIPLLTKAS